MEELEETKALIADTLNVSFRSPTANERFSDNAASNILQKMVIRSDE